MQHRANGRNSGERWFVFICIKLLNISNRLQQLNKYKRASLYKGKNGF